MKWSIYNELIDDVDNAGLVYLFNSLREKFFALDVNLKGLMLAGSHDTSVIEDAHPDLYKYLASEDFIIPDNMDEVSECIQMVNKKFSSDKHLRITINPTLDCNLRCWYCYENHHKGSCMEAKTIDALMKFIEGRAQSESLKKIQLSFFGGEPLLKYNQVVKPIVEGCGDICRKHNKSFMVSFTTNGVCLTSAVVRELKELSPEVSVQVAFDGNRTLHDTVKCFADGSGCYDIVKGRLDYAINNGIMTTIRCNYTLKNFDSFRELIEDFKDYWHYSNVRFSFHKVWQEPESEELFAKRKSLKQDILRWGIKSNIDSFYGDSLAPCYADFDNHIVVNYNGDIYKCTARDFKLENRLGYLDDTGEIIYNAGTENRVLTRLTKQCFSCRMLPICTICFQQRRESIDGACPMPNSYENAPINIAKYFHDVMSLKKRMSIHEAN
jgi:uncharacterized protein